MSPRGGRPERHERRAAICRRKTLYLDVTCALGLSRRVVGAILVMRWTYQGRGSTPEVIFLVEEAPEGGFTARALGESIFTEADGISELHEKVRDAVRCHFDEDEVPKVIRLHFVREEAITA